MSKFCLLCVLAVATLACSNAGSTTPTLVDGAVDSANDAVPTDGASRETPGDTTMLSDTTGGTDGSGDSADAVADAGCKPGRGTWVWGSNVVEKSADRAAFFAFAASHPVRTAYVEAEGLLGGSDDPPLLASFVAEAKARCIDVELLFGNATWLRPATQAIAIALANKAVAFAKKHPGAAPVGVHFDVEPHGLPEWHGDMWDENNETLVGHYLDLLDKLKMTTAGSGLTLSVDIPFWYDGTRQVTRGGKRRPAMELVIDAVDVTTIMDYRDVAAGSDGIVANASAELKYASGVGKRVVVGLETECGLTPTFVTFCEEGAAVLETQLAAAQASFALSSAFAGFAIHHYGSWNALGK